MSNLKVSDPAGLVKATLLIGATAYVLRYALTMSGLKSSVPGTAVDKIIP